MATALLVHVLYQPWAERWGGDIIHVNPTRESLGLAPFEAPTPLDFIAAARATLVLLPAELDSPADLPPGVHVRRPGVRRRASLPTTAPGGARAAGSGSRRWSW